MPHIVAIQQLIDLLQDTRSQIASIENLPDNYRLKAERTLTVLANQSAHNIGGAIEDVAMAQVEFPPITHFMGRELNIAKPAARKSVDPEALGIYKKKLEAIIESMGGTTPKEFYDRCSESEIRGVAKMLGLAVTTTEPDIITMKFIEDIYEAYEAKLKQDELNNEVEAGKAKLNQEDLDDETLTEDEERAVLVQQVIEQMQETSKTLNIPFSEEDAENVRQELKETPLDEIRETIAKAVDANTVLTEESKTAPTAPTAPIEQPKETTKPATKKK